jgi:hypothetical protein
MPHESKSLQGVEIFSVGTWNGDTYTQKDLDEMVKAFKQTSKTLQPPLKLGHSENQKILQSDGLPSAGWVNNVYSRNGKLLADFVDIPNKIYQLLEKGSYKKVSSEILWNANINGQKFTRMLAAVALLGADMPAVTNLNDIMSVHAHTLAEFIKNYASDTDSLIIKAYHLNLKDIGGHRMPTELEIKLEKDLIVVKDQAEKLEEQVKTYAKDVDASKKILEEKEKENEELKKFKADAEARAIESAKQLEEVSLEKTLTELQSEKMISPSMKPYVKALLSEEKKEYSFKNKETEEKFTKPELLKQILKLFSQASAVNFVESSEDNSVKGEKDEKALNEQINQYAKEHKVTYSAAYRAVAKKSNA